MKFGNLLKKELSELLTVQSIIAMLTTCFLLIIMGQTMGGAMEEAFNSSQVNIVDMDGSEFTADMLKALPEYGAEPKVITDFDTENPYDEMKRLDITNVVIIPRGFGDTAAAGNEAAKVECISLLDKGGLASSMSSLSGTAMAQAVSNYVADYIRSEKFNLNEDQAELLEDPVVIEEFTASNGTSVPVSAEDITSVLMRQFMIAPMAVFFLILMASQMIMTAVSTEKIDKTLETLLSAPVSRVAVLASKMTAALIVALLNAGATIIGFVFYIQGMTGSAAAEAQGAEGGMSVSQALTALGLTLSPADVVIFGIELFLTIAIGLSVSMILGAMATDVKSVQTLVMPVMILTMIPFFVTMFTDVNSLPLLPKIFMYAIPFTHTFSAMNNMMFGNMAQVWGGLVYQIIFFAVCMYAAVKIFTTDLLFTMHFPVIAKGKKKTAASSAE